MPLDQLHTMFQAIIFSRLISHIEEHSTTLPEIGHGFELPSYKYSYKLHKQSFLTNCLFKYLSTRN